MSLTITQIKNTKAIDKTQRLFDGKGLYLEVSPKGGKWWRHKYRFNGKERRLSLGVYPDTSLQRAREKLEDNRKLLADKIDPSAARQLDKRHRLDQETNTFESIAREWHKQKKPTLSEKYAKNIVSGLERDIFPSLGKKIISEITPKELLDCIRKIEARGTNETAHRRLKNCSEIFCYAVASSRTDRDIATDITGALAPKTKSHLAAITDPDKIGPLLRMIEQYEGTPVVKCALRLAPLVFVRPGELRQAEWSDIDLENAEWRFTVTKTNTPHIVPLSKQSIEVLEEIKILTGNGQYVFPSQRSIKRPMSDNAILAAFRTMGIPKEEMSGHGFRAMARTLLDEVLGCRPDFIEHQLAHAVRDPNGRAYNRTSHLVERKIMMQEWADYLDKLKKGAEVISIHG